ncbi:MAG TPA: hypothetical protein VEB00_04865 [Clostridia bacterium]|nr:hypothetical protein [Clostridia bacterium]
MNVSLTEVIQATSVLLVFVTLLFGLKYPENIRDLNMKKPLAGECAIRDFRKELIKRFVVNNLPQIVLFGITGYIFLPTFCDLIASTKFSIWNFEFLPTTFFCIVIWVWWLFLWVLQLSVRLIYKIIKCK